MYSLGQLVAGIAHEVNNPVNFIHGNLIHLNQYILDIMQLLHLYEKHYSQPVLEIQDKAVEIELDFLRQDLPNIIDSMTVGSERIREIVKSLRNFSRLDEAQVKQVDIHEGLDSTLMILQHRLKADGDRSAIEVIKEYGDLPLVECYAGQLNQVFMNILTNAIDAIDKLQSADSEGKTPKKPGLITIRTEIKSQSLRDNPEEVFPSNSLSPTSQVLIRIANNGPSIDENVQKRIFDPFFTTNSVGKGTGLGMSISYSIIVEKHRGKLSCISSPGQGVEFVIEIPLSLIGH
jgi:two-component system NtrC family sensor kinase